MTPYLFRALVPALVGGIIIASPASAQLSESELVMRLNRLENQMRQLTGQVEQLQYRNGQLEQQLGRAAQGGPPPQRAAAPPQYAPQAYPAQPQSYPQQQAYPPQPNVMQQEPYPAAPPPAAGRRGDAFDPNQNPSAPGVPRALGAPGTVAAAPPLGATARDEPPYVGSPGGPQ